LTVAHVSQLIAREEAKKNNDNELVVRVTLARWLRVGALVVCIGQRMAALFTRRVCAAWWASAR